MAKKNQSNVQVVEDPKTTLEVVEDMDPEAVAAALEEEANKLPSGFDDEDKGFTVEVIINEKVWGRFSHTTKALATKKARRVIRQAELGFTVKAMEKKGETPKAITWVKA